MVYSSLNYKFARRPLMTVLFWLLARNACVPTIEWEGARLMPGPPGFQSWCEFMAASEAEAPPAANEPSHSSIACPCADALVDASDRRESALSSPMLPAEDTASGELVDSERGLVGVVGQELAARKALPVDV